ncbi:hypothetical protein JCM17844_00660 [Iodidimonas gelatinilytica]|uniref:PEP-CTERM system TPR-repeat protein PrsT n=1 Tax=Iodidimonas gelatinilytica TaxID=1236966 RepID=A0A5A7MNG1_9PROT|nr:XrtA/PEP-CTERM system TPR-repeat protein PrsT [Iodidimonas gelatinilytica]GEQ96429.1 hypothetical protein JCM17844_00660 [Iodidimonas gelatinilytica]
MKKSSLVRSIGASLMFAAVLGTAACSPGDPESRAQKYYESAQTKYQANEVSAAVIELKNALQESAQFAPARLLLGKIYLENYQIAQAEKELTRARDLGAAPEDYLAPLMLSHVLATKYVEALSLVEAAPAEAQILPEVIDYHADALVGQGRYASARELLNNADPMTGDHLARLGQIAVLEGDPEQAARLSQQALETDPDSLVANLLAGRLAIREDDMVAAEGYFSKAVEIDPTSPPASLTLTTVLIDQEKLDEALATLEALARRGISTMQAVYLRSLIALQQQDFELAKSAAEQVLSSAPRNRPALLVAGVANSALGNDEVAITYLQRFANDDQIPLVASRALAWSSLRLGRADDALEAAGRSAEESGDAASLRLATAAALQSGQLDKAVSYMQTVLENEPDNLSLATGLATLKLSAGDKDGADDILKRIPSNGVDRTTEEQIRLGIVHLRAGNTQQALEIAQGLRQKSPNSAAGYSLAGLALVQDGQQTAAVEQFEQALEIEPGSWVSVNALVSLLRAQDREDEALTVLETAHEAKPDNVQIAMALAQMKALAGDVAESEAILKKMVDAAPDAIEPRIAYARMLLLLGKPGQALTEAQSASKMDPANPAALETVGLAYRAQGEHRKAVDVFQSMIGQLPENADARYLLGRSLAEAGSDEAAIDAMRRTIDLDGNKLEARTALIRLLALRGEMDGAKSELETLRAISQPNAALYDLEGFVALSDGKAKDASRKYRQAYETEPTPLRAVTLARSLWVAEDKKDAIHVLEGRSEPMSRLQLAQFYFQENRAEDAKEQYRILTRENPKNPVYFNDFAWVLWENGDLDEAYENATKAMELAPNAPAIQDTYGVIALARGDVDGAIEALQPAFEAASHDPDIALHLAKAYLARGRTSEARTLLQDLAGRDGFSGQAEARELLSTL